MIPKEFGPRLKLSRHRKNLNQIEISKMLKISRQAYGNYEFGRAVPSVYTLAELTLLLDTDFFSIFLEAAASDNSFQSNNQQFDFQQNSSSKRK